MRNQPSSPGREPNAVQAPTLLVEAIETISEGFAFFDPQDRLVLFNSKFREMHGPSQSVIKPGVSYETILRAAAEAGHFIDAANRVEWWLSEQLVRHSQPPSTTVQHLADGSWLQFRERHAADGGTFVLLTDITERRHAEEEKRRSDNLLNVVIPIGVALSAEQDFDRLLEKILLEAKAFCHADAGTLYLRGENDQLRFVIVRNDSLKIAMGGTSGNPINFPPVPMFHNGQPNHSNVAAHVALTGQAINIPDAYEARGFNFSGTKAFDNNTGYRSTSFLTIPLINPHNEVVGVLQLINAQEPRTGQIIPFAQSLEQIVLSLSSLATVALEAYIREQKLRRQIQQLRIEIDEVKRQQQVNEIVDTDFFQDLQAKARSIRRRSQREGTEDSEASD